MAKTEACMYCYNGVCFKPSHIEDGEIAAPSERCHSHDKRRVIDHHIIV